MRKSVLSLAVFAALFSACSSTPSCDSSDTTKLLDQIYKEQLLPEIGLSKSQIAKYELEFSDIVTQRQSKDGKVNYCSATFTASHPSFGTESNTINYTVEGRDNGQFYVQILDN